VLHPLFGYTYNPSHKGINNFGFPTSYDVLIEAGRQVLSWPQGDSLVVGVFGGSFAQIVAADAAYLEHHLRRMDTDRDPVVLNFAIGGYALPQTAFVYLYFRELFDVVVFIDGVNEVWNYLENNRSGVPPEYAKAAHFLFKTSQRELSPQQFEGAARILSLKENMRTLLRISSLPLLRDSVAMHSVFTAWISRWGRLIAEVTREIELTYTARDSFFPLESDEVLEHAAVQWVRYHRMIHDIASQDGVLSLHLLQPNPFVPDTKVLTEEERELIARSFPIEPHVTGGYPKLQSQLQILQAEGVVAVDLTAIYRPVEDSIWIDSCHANPKGSRMVLDEIARLIRAHAQPPERAE
jgi:hypothetical protein